MLWHEGAFGMMLEKPHSGRPQGVWSPTRTLARNGLRGDGSADPRQPGQTHGLRVIDPDDVSGLTRIYPLHTTSGSPNQRPERSGGGNIIRGSSLSLRSFGTRLGNCHEALRQRGVYPALALLNDVGQLMGK